MSIEIEAKYHVDDADLVIRQLCALEARRQDPLLIEDTYFDHPTREFSLTHEALRIRVQNGEAVLTYKSPAASTRVKAREELEVALGAADSIVEPLSAVLQRLGFTPSATIHKKRFPYVFKDGGRTFNLMLDDVDELGMFLEVETIVPDNETTAAAEAAVLAIGERLGVRSREPRSYIDMITGESIEQEPHYLD